MQPIYMNATTCKMFLPTWLKVNKSFKNKYKLDFTNSNHKNEVQIYLQKKIAHESREQRIEHRTLTGSVYTLITQVFKVRFSQFSTNLAF